MAKSGPGRSHREGLTIVQLLGMFATDAAAEAWFEKNRWPEGRYCPDCGSVNTVPVKTRKPMPYRCRDCRNHFSVRKGTVMQSSKLGLQKWAIALYLTATGIKGTASMKVYRDLGMRQATAWHLMHRIREAFDDGVDLPFPGPVEADETFVGGRRKNKPKHQRKEPKRTGIVGKTIVAGVRDRETEQVSAAVVPDTKAETLVPFVEDRTELGATVYTDTHPSYRRLQRAHETVDHRAGEYVRGDAHTQGIESFWAMLKRAHKGTCHHLSEKHLGRYVREFAGRHYIRDLDTVAQMATLARGMVGKRLRYKDLVAG